MTKLFVENHHITFTDKRKSLSVIIIQIKEGLWRKLNNLKPLFSRNAEELYVSKEVKENALVSEGKPCRPETITSENQYACRKIMSREI